MATVTTLTAVAETLATNANPIELTFTRAAGNAGDLYHSLFFCVGKEGGGDFNDSGITFDGVSARVQAVANSEKIEGINRIKWFEVANVGTGSHTISVPNVTGNDIRKSIAGVTIADSHSVRSVGAQTVSATSGTVLTNSNVTGKANDIVLSGATHGEIATHTWSGGATEFSDISGFSETLTAAQQTIAWDTTTVSPVCTASITINRLAMSTIVVRQLEGSPISFEWTYRKDNNNPEDRNFTTLGTLDWRRIGITSNYLTNHHLRDVASGTPGTAPQSWPATASGGTLTAGDSSQPNATGVKTVGLSVTTNRHYYSHTTTQENFVTSTTYYFSILATITSGTSSFDSLISVAAGTATPTITSRTVDGSSVAGGDTVTGTLVVLRIGFTVGGTGTVIHRFGVGVNANVTANVTFERPLTSIKTDRTSWPVVGDRKLNGTLIGPVEKVSTAQGSFLWTTGNSTKDPTTQWTNGTVDSTSSGQRDIPYVSTTVSGYGIKVVTGALGSKRTRFTVGWSTYQADATIVFTVSDGSNTQRAFSFSAGTGVTPSFESIWVVEVSDPTATGTITLTATDTDGNVVLSYIYAEDWPYELAVHDTFTDTNGVDINNHVPHIDFVGGGWSIVPAGWADSAPAANTVEIQSNNLQESASGVAAQIELNSRDCIVMYDWIIGGSTGQRTAIYIARHDSTENHYFNIREPNNGGDYNFYRVENSAVAQTYVDGNSDATARRVWSLSKTYGIELRMLDGVMNLRGGGDNLRTHTITQIDPLAHTTTRVAMAAASITQNINYGFLVIWRPYKINTISGLVKSGVVSGLIR